MSESMSWVKQQTVELVCGPNWEDGKGSVWAKTFGVMVDLAGDRIKYYKSDLFHDALWLREKLNGPMQFDWIARESGTFIGETVQHIKLEEWPEAVKYRFEILCEDEKRWMLNVWEAVKDSVLDRVFPEENPTLGNNEPVRKERTLESIISDLQEKVQEADQAKDSLEEAKSDIDDAVQELENYIDEVQSLIESLESLPSVSVYVELDTVQFDS